MTFALSRFCESMLARSPSLLGGTLGRTAKRENYEDSLNDIRIYAFGQCVDYYLDDITKSILHDGNSIQLR